MGGVCYPIPLTQESLRRTSALHRHHRARLHSPLTPPNVLACGPVPARTAGLPDVDDASVGRQDGAGARGGRPIRRHRPRVAGSPSACRRDRPAGRHYGAIRPGYPAIGAQAGRATGAAAYLTLPMDRLRRRGDRKRKDEASTMRLHVFHPHASSVGLDDCFGNGQA